ncbi:hypothetical protein PT286_01400 [Neisseriaceae bacterium ESL0693]|nr:hypothetical protein [Neisseriaceae bacterium ESL0693]
MLKYSYTIAYIVLNGLSVLIIHGVGQQIPIDTMIMLSSLYALIFFHLLNIGGLKTLYQQLYHHKKLYLIMISVFLVMWLVCFIIPVYYTPAILMFYATAWPALFGSYKKYRVDKGRLNKYTAVCIALTMMLFYVFLGHVYHGTRYMWLIGGTLLAGISMFLYSTYSFRMNNAGFSPSQILASRFVLLFLFALGWSVYSRNIFHINAEVAAQALVVSIASLILPIYCSQISIKRVGPLNHSIAMGVTPFVAFMFEYGYLGKNGAVSFDGIFSVILMLIILAMPTIYLFKSKASQ